MLQANYVSKLLSLILSIAIPYSVLAQQEKIEVNRNIQWQAPVSFQAGAKTVHTLSFNKAQYPSSENQLPYYIEQVPVDFTVDEIDITNPLYVPLSEEDKTAGVNFDDVAFYPSISVEMVISRKQKYAEITLLPLRKNPETGELEKLVVFTLTLIGNEPARAFLKSASTRYAEQSVLRFGQWYKIGIDKTGIYKISYNKLKELGFDNIANIRVYGNGGNMLPKENDKNPTDDLAENAIWLEKGSDGVFNEGDYLLFYAEGPVVYSWDEESGFFNHALHEFTPRSHYFLTTSLGPGKRINEADFSAQSSSLMINEFLDHDYHESENVNLLKSGAAWYGEVFDLSTSHDYSFNFPGIIPERESKIKVSAIGRDSSAKSFNISVNGTTVGNLGVDGVHLGTTAGTYASAATDYFSVSTGNNDFTVTVDYLKSPGSSAKGWLDYITVNAWRELSLSGSQIAFRNPDIINEGGYVKFILKNAGTNTLVFDVTDIHNPTKMKGSLNGSSFEFKAPAGNLHEYVAVDITSTIPSPSYTGDKTGWIDNQNLHGIRSVDLVIVTHPDFIEQADTLAWLHRNQDNMEVIVATTEEVYNEFSSGMPDVGSIKWFMKMLYDRANEEEEIVKYLMLVGDGSFNNRYWDKGNPCYILTYQSPSSLVYTGSYVSDDFYGILDDDEHYIRGKLDIGIGRLTVTNQQEANAVVNKILNYCNPESSGSWRSQITFVGDDEDEGVMSLHMSQANEMAGYVEQNFPEFMIEKIYLDAYKQVTTSSGKFYPEAKAALNRRVEKGALIINYTGHGNENGLAHEQLVLSNDIQKWKNFKRLPLFITATCEFSRFDDVEVVSVDEYKPKTSAGEYILLNENGGGIGLMTTTRLVYASPNFQLNQQFYYHVFERDINGNKNRLGDIIRLSKSSLSSNYTNKRSFTLLGDPALKLPFPSYSIVVDSINGMNVSSSTDTISAFDQVIVSGHVEDYAGNSVPGFNGTLYSTVFDKERIVTTLGNDNKGTYTYKTRDNIIFRGKASVKEGDFTFAFPVPKDINYSFGEGKINLFANNGITDASGSYEGFIIGGISETAEEDITGPDISLYMNDTTFINGGMTNGSPILMARVFDENGINTSGGSIGHNITAVIDDDYSNIHVLNEYFEADLDNFRKGTVFYPLQDIESGEHTARIKVWDTYNNSSEAEITFIVKESGELIITNLQNYPNPFSAFTDIYFNHNMPGVDMDVEIYIYNLSGSLVRILEQEMNTGGYTSAPISWDGFDNQGGSLSQGIYIYRLRVTTQNKQIAEKSDKILISH